MPSPKDCPGPSGELTAAPYPQLQPTDAPIFFLYYLVMISPANFFIFQYFDFWGFMGVKGQKMT